MATACLVVSAATLGAWAEEDGTEVGAVLADLPIARLLAVALLSSSLVLAGLSVHGGGGPVVTPGVPGSAAPATLSTYADAATDEEPSRPIDRRLGIELSGYEAPARRATAFAGTAVPF